MDAYLSDFYLWAGLEPTAWFALFFVASLLDAVTTLYALNKGGYEANPVLRLLMARMPAPMALFAVKVPQAAALWASLQVNILYMPVIALAFVTVCVWNVGVILRMR